MSCRTPSRSLGTSSPKYDLNVSFHASGRSRTLSLQDIHWSFRSEEHTSELQSHSDLVCRLLLEKKKISAHHMHQVHYPPALQFPETFADIVPCAYQFLRHVRGVYGRRGSLKKRLYFVPRRVSVP